MKRYSVKEIIKYLETNLIQQCINGNFSVAKDDRNYALKMAIEEIECPQCGIAEAINKS